MATAAPPEAVTILIDGVRYLGQVNTGTDEEWTDFQVSEPDIHWSLVDDAGHLHAFDTYSSELPTVYTASAHIPCNGECPEGECDGYTETRHFCRICNERIHPKWNTVTRNTKVAEMHWWRARAQGPVMMPGGTVSVRIQSEGWPERFGIAYVTGADINFSDNTAELELEGTGRLGFRPLPEVAAKEQS